MFRNTQKDKHIFKHLTNFKKYVYLIEQNINTLLIFYILLTCCKIMESLVFFMNFVENNLKRNCLTFSDRSEAKLGITSKKKLSMQEENKPLKKIYVHVRVRDKDIQNSDNSEIGREDDLWTVKDNILYQKLNDTTLLSYSCYQNVFIESKTNEIYSKCVRDVVLDVNNGTNCTIFAYGQTGSGKTYTMMGTKVSKGIIQMSLEDILSSNNKLDSRSVKKWGITSYEVSYLEIYNENVIDLINPSQKVQIYGTGTASTISNLTKIKIKNLNDALQILQECESRRKIGQTEFNERSSRSHTIFQLHITKNNQINTLSLIDLAGSERATGNSDRRKEGAFINRSLLALGSVVNRLVKNEYVNYRDSKLTRILQHSLDGKSNVVSLCMISPFQECLLESISTLKFAARLSKVELKERLDRIVTQESKAECDGCKCCVRKKEETLCINKSNFNEDVILKNSIKDNKIDFNDVVKNETTAQDIKEMELLIAENNYLKAENALLSDRIKNLECSVMNLISQNPSKRINDLFILEKNMFNLQLEMIKRKRDF
ncbi:hypothetical protein EDEG_03686 [Edhazardia aedis USNM 41457]|uniref:Kinesin motor domain-containing protein n=1 Tax=Edhazardia aedis (strain USNM 41457) TaxID=1003232 RepID=J9DGV7_EDHAE|nr:hypothetical protein EDEG_03686 [Edhazardia aedis USNM 41457]|eukprot:EJW01840.1 hypothetical protein EDEG_03686 [Edhazardia aedis USNM 41457]